MMIYNLKQTHKGISICSTLFRLPHCLTRKNNCWEMSLTRKRRILSFDKCDFLIKFYLNFLFYVSLLDSMRYHTLILILSLNKYLFDEAYKSRKSIRETLGEIKISNLCWNSLTTEPTKNPPKALKSSNPNSFTATATNPLNSFKTIPLSSTNLLMSTLTLTTNKKEWQNSHLKAYAWLNPSGGTRLISKAFKYFFIDEKEQKIVASHPDLEDVKQSRYLKSFYSEYDHNNSRFRKSKGEFTAFI